MKWYFAIVGWTAVAFALGLLVGADVITGIASDAMAVALGVVAGWIANRVTSKEVA